MCVWIALSGLALWSGVAELRYDLSTIDVTKFCSIASSEPCLSRQSVRVEQVDSGLVTFSYDDGRFTWEVELIDRAPAPRTRLLLEHWGDEIVSLYDARAERRFRTDRWPGHWSPEGGLLIAAGLLMLAPVLALLGVLSVVSTRRLVRRRRPRPAA